MASHLLNGVPDTPAVLRRMRARSGPSGRSLPEPHASSAAEGLGRLLGLRGTLRLAEYLEASARAGGEHSPVSSVVDARLPAVTARVHERCASIRAEAVTSLERPFEGPSAVPEPVALADALVDAGALASLEKRRWGKVGKALGPLYARPFGHVVSLARKKLRWVRSDAIAILQNQGPRLRALVDLDEALFTSLEPGVLRILDRTEASLSLHFTDRLLAARPHLGGCPGPDALAAALRERGFITAFVDDVAALSLSVLDREIEAMRALVDAATEELRGEQTE